MKIKVDKDIVLQKVRLKSAGAIFDCMDRSRDTLRVWLPFVDATRTKADTEAYIRSVQHKKGPMKDLIMEVIYRDEVAGLLGMKDIDTMNRKAEIGYWLGKEAVGKGVMTRSCIALINHAFNEMGLNRLQVKCAVENTRSCNIPKQLGFTYEGIERHGELLHGKYHDLKVYSLLKKEWMKK